MLKTTRNVLSLVLAVASLETSLMLAGCAGNGKVSVTIGDWPASTDSTATVYEEYKNTMAELYPIALLLFVRQIKMVYNPTVTDVWFMQNGKTYCVHGGETISLE